MKKSFKQKTFLTLALIATALFLIGFYYYNYVANHRGQARELNLPGLHAYVCKGAAHVAGHIDQCGRRGIYRDADWGVTAYFTIYGVESREDDLPPTAVPI